MRRYLIDKLSWVQGVLHHPGGPPFTGAAFERSGTGELTGRMYADGVDIGTYQSPTIPSVGRFTILDAEMVVNDGTGVWPYPGDPMFLLRGERFTGVTLEPVEGCETLWIDGLPVLSATHGEGLVEYMRVDGPVYQTYETNPDSGPRQPVRVDVKVKAAGATALTLTLEYGLVKHRSIGDDYLRLIEPFRNVLLVPQLADPEFVASIPAVGEPFDLALHP